MIHARTLPFGFRVPGGIKRFILAWLVSELAVFLLVVHVVGFVGAILLGLLTSVLGVVMLRRIGLDASVSLHRAALGNEPPKGALLDGMLSALGAMLLILPGFVANFAGCALAAPSVRKWAAQRFDGAGTAGPGPRVGRRASPDIIDLPAEDWRIVDRR